MDPGRPPLPTSYVPQARYEKVIEAFGGDGYFVETPDQLRPALDKAFAGGKPSVVNIMINPSAQRKPQQFAWLTR
jgi:2-hydroxyacyl-CoA lyase 1